MKLTKYDPWNMVARMQDEMARYFPRSLPQYFPELEPDDMLASWTPAVDIKETDAAYLVKADIPGVPPENIEVSMEDGALIIRGQREEEKKTDENGYRRTERFSGSFYRRFALPTAVQEDKIKAVDKHGVLEISIPKAESGKRTHRIKVSA